MKGKSSILIILFFLVCNPAYAKEISILYTGDTHSMLYPCNCPREPDGGVARRAALVKALRENNPGTLLLDSGGFFAGGVLDEYTQNTQLDLQRTVISLLAMEKMKYDAVNVSDDEFNFGKEFLLKMISSRKIPFVSSNINLDQAKRYIIKDLEGTRIGILGVSGLYVKQKAVEVKVLDPLSAVKDTVMALKQARADIIILLSRLSEEENMDLVRNVPGIDIVISGYNRTQKNAVNKIGGALIVKASWQGRKMGRLSLKIEDNKIVDFQAEDIRLSSQISDDQEIKSIMIPCFSDANCKKEGFVGFCRNAGVAAANCMFIPAIKIGMKVIMPKQCRGCSDEAVIAYLKNLFPGITVSRFYYPGKEADKLIRDLGLNALPVFLFDKGIEKGENFNEDFKKLLQYKGDVYILKPEFSGIAYYLERKMMPGRLDLFIGLYDKETKDLLDIIKEYNPDIHFIISETAGGFNAAGGRLEIEDSLRGVCMQKYYPDHFLDYISCRAKNTDSSWWEDCADKQVDTNKISACAKGREGANLLKENIKLNRQLLVTFGPAYLLDNTEIFATKGIPKKEDFKKIFKKIASQ